MRQLNSQLIFLNYEKLKSFVETFTPNNKILTFQDQSCMSFYRFGTDQAQIKK
jgi:hypothetical protein